MPMPTVHERHFGNIEFAQLNLDSMFCVSQIRDRINPQFEEIKESIDQEDLDNPVNVARVTWDELCTYIDFTNKTWGATAKPEDFVGHEQPDGRFNLVVAGHNRFAGMQSLAEDHTAETGQATHYTVLCKIMKDNSVGAIVAKQALENLHGSVRQERTAMVVIELYQYGLGTKWNNANEFRRQYGKKISGSMLNEAITFAALSPQVRSMVFGGYLSYKAGLELSKAAVIIREWIGSEVGLRGDQLTPELALRAERRVRGMAARIGRQRLNSTAATKHIRAITAGMQQEIDARRASTSVPDMEQDMLFEMVTPEQQAREIQRREDAFYEGCLREVSDEPFAVAAQVLSMLRVGDESEIADRVLRDAQKAHETLMTQLGRKPVTSMVA